MRLHIGSGPVSLPGWTNVDIAAYPGVDVVLDIRQPWPFSGVDFIFAEHFIEHLTLGEGLKFLRSARAALTKHGVLRLSTPNLDWVWLTHYKHPEEMTENEKLQGCLEINRAFHGWGHQFLYNIRTLELALRDAGFLAISHSSYGESQNEELRGLERHDDHPGLPAHPSVIIVEASGIAPPRTELRQEADQFLRDFAAR